MSPKERRVAYLTDSNERRTCAKDARSELLSTRGDTNLGEGIDIRRERVIIRSRKGGLHLSAHSAMKFSLRTESVVHVVRYAPWAHSAHSALS